jgi:hypothetical protein
MSDAAVERAGPPEDAERALALINEMHAELGKKGLARIEEGLRAYAAGTEPVVADPTQFSHIFYVKGLTAKPWYDRGEFPWTASFEAATKDVLREFHVVEEADVGRSDWSGYGIGWVGRRFYSGGTWDEDTCALAPITASLLRSVHYTQGDFLYSIVKPRGTIPHHSGGVNAVLSCHLALIVPEGCKIRVGGVWGAWEPGKVLAFDDSFSHAVWNTSRDRRVCLVWEVWHPELSEVERAAMVMVYARLLNLRPAIEDGYY